MTEETHVFFPLALVITPVYRAFIQKICSMNFEVQRSGIKNRRWGKCTFIGGNTNIYQENKKSNFDFSPFYKY
jgi:hypothetical protein